MNKPTEVLELLESRDESEDSSVRIKYLCESFRLLNRRKSLLEIASKWLDSAGVQRK